MFCAESTGVERIALRPAHGHEIAEAFYERMLALSDDELNAGDLPRDEVLEGIERVRSTP